MVRRTFDLLDRYHTNFRSVEVALAAKQNGKWITYSPSEYTQYSNYISYGLLEMGFKAGDKIATISNNRPEWNFLDMGMAQIGVVHVPIYPTISLDDYQHIFLHSEPKMLVVSDRLLIEKLRPIIAKASSIESVYSFNQIQDVANWIEIVELGKTVADKYTEKLEKAKDSVLSDDLATIIYTSGTTGVPKGVMLSHRNLVSNFIATSYKHNLGPGDRVLSFLPICHIYERSLNYHFQNRGLSIYYAENMGTLLENLKEVKPHIFNTVPRLLERVYDGIIGKGKDLPFIKKALFFGAVYLGDRFDLKHQNSWFYKLQLKVADLLIFSKWRDVLGGEVQYIVCGGAALQIRLGKIFCAAGMTILEGYGLSESGPVIAVNDPVKKHLKIGTVGPVLEGIDVKIAEDGEILCKGPNVMLGYYKDPEMTNDVIDSEGWLHTGDVGVIEDDIYLKITDRKKEIFKLSSGKYVAPQVIENKLKESFIIEQSMVIGEHEKFASALIVPNFQYLQSWCSHHKIEYPGNDYVIKYPEIQEKFQREVNHINHLLGKTEHIKRFRLVGEEWTPQTGELSPTLKLKRKYIHDKYSAVIEDIYSIG